MIRAAEFIYKFNLWMKGHDDQCRERTRSAIRDQREDLLQIPFTKQDMRAYLMEPGVAPWKVPRL